MVVGPAKVVQRTGASSYKVIHKPGEIWDVHLDSLKPYVEDDILGTETPLYFHKGTTRSTGLSDETDEVQAIQRHRLRGGRLEFLTTWRGAPRSESTWEPVTAFVKSFSPASLTYLAKNRLEGSLNGLQ